jgi:hypothetical protein
MLRVRDEIPVEANGQTLGKSSQSLSPFTALVPDTYAGASQPPDKRTNHAGEKHERKNHVRFGVPQHPSKLNQPADLGDAI